MRNHRWSLVVAALLAIGCKSDPKDPKTWIGQLDGDHDQQVRALRELKALKSADAVPALIPLLKDVALREDVAAVLEAIGDKRAVGPLAQALDTSVGAGTDKATQKANNANTRIAAALAALGDQAAVPSLRQLLKSRDNYVRIAAIDALGTLAAKEAADDLIAIADDEATPPLLIKKCIVALGQMGDVKALPLFERMLVLEKGGVSFLSETSYALFQLGDAAVQPLMDLLEDKDAAYVKWAKDHDRAMAGVYAKAALVLGDLADPRAAPALLGKLKYTDDNTDPDKNFFMTSYVRAFAADSLGHIRARAAAPQIAALLSGDAEQATEDLDYFAGRATVSLGDRSVAGKLLAAAAKKGEWKLRTYLITTAATLADLKDRPALEKLAVGEEDDHVKFISAQVLKLAAADECKTTVACWQGKLKDANAGVRERAAWELGWAGSVDSLPSLVAAAKDDALDARLAAFRAIDFIAHTPAGREAAKRVAPALAAQLAGERGKVQYVKVDEDLKRLVTALQRI